MGDEDGGVGLQCKVCDRGGLPVVYLTSTRDWHSYHGTDVAVTRTIADFLEAAGRHRHTL
jgi:hypothetical protein